MKYLQIRKRKAFWNTLLNHPSDAADMARLNEETEIEEYLRSKVASSHRTEGQEVEQDVTYAYILSDVYSYSFGSLQYIYSLSEDLKSLSL